MRFLLHALSLTDSNDTINLKQLYPNLPTLATEATLEAYWKQTDRWLQGQYYAIDIIGDLNNWALGWIDWNFLLDVDGRLTTTE